MSSQSANLLQKLITALRCPKLRYHHESVDLSDTNAIRPRHCLPTFQVPQVSLHCATVGRRSGTCLLTATLCHPKLWYHHESDDLPDTSTVGTKAPCPACADVRRMMSYVTDLVWYSLLPSAPVNRAQGCKRSRDNATTIGPFPSRHGMGPYGPGSHYREGTHHQPSGGGSWRLGRRVSTRSSAKFASSVARLYDGFESQDFIWRKSSPGCHRQQYEGARHQRRDARHRQQYLPRRGGGGYYQQGCILGP